jgi:AraC family transcriptional regulator
VRVEGTIWHNHRVAVAPYLFPDGARFGADNLMLHARARRHRTDDFAGPLSIKTVVAGAVTWRLGGRDLPVDPASFLVLGAGEWYSLNIDTAHDVETACAFFRDGFVEAVAHDAATPVEAALDDPARFAPGLPWISRLHLDPERHIVARVQSMARRASGQILPSAYEEDFLRLARDLLRLYRQIAARIDRMPALRSPTRLELFRRVERAREYLHAHQHGPVSLDDAARAACLSRYHFHRAFTEAHRRTPHEYVTGLRLERGRTLLESGESVQSAALAVGFSGAPAFARLFRSRYGLTPGEVRRSRQQTAVAL